MDNLWTQFEMHLLSGHIMAAFPTVIASEVQARNTAAGACELVWELSLAALCIRCALLEVGQYGLLLKRGHLLAVFINILPPCTKMHDCCRKTKMPASTGNNLIFWKIDFIYSPSERNPDNPPGRQGLAFRKYILTIHIALPFEVKTKPLTFSC